MKPLLLITGLILCSSLQAATSGQLFLRARVPATTALVWNERGGKYEVKTNEGRHSVRTQIRETQDERGVRFLTVIHQ